MKKLIIVRHAKSSWDHAGLDDHDRPLNRRGKKNAPEMGRRLAKRNINPEIIISSTAKRAAATARRIAEEISFTVSEIRKEPLFYHGSIRDIVAVLQSVSDDINTVMIFGHNPGFTDLTNFLSGSDIYNIPTCGNAEIDFDVLSWREVGENSGDLVYFDYPKKISRSA
jgi:phosphohistidine phosphatase